MQSMRDMLAVHNRSVGAARATAVHQAHMPAAVYMPAFGFPLAGHKGTTGHGPAGKSAKERAPSRSGRSACKATAPGRS